MQVGPPAFTGPRTMPQVRPRPAKALSHWSSNAAYAKRAQNAFCAQSDRPRAARPSMRGCAWPSSAGRGAPGLASRHAATSSASRSPAASRTEAAADGLQTRRAPRAQSHAFPSPACVGRVVGHESGRVADDRPDLRGQLVALNGPVAAADAPVSPALRAPRSRRWRAAARVDERVGTSTYAGFAMVSTMADNYFLPAALGAAHSRSTPATSTSRGRVAHCPALGSMPTPGARGPCAAAAADGADGGPSRECPRRV